MPNRACRPLFVRHARKERRADGDASFAGAAGDSRFRSGAAVHQQAAWARKRCVARGRDGAKAPAAAGPLLAILPV